MGEDVPKQPTWGDVEFVHRCNLREWLLLHQPALEPVLQQKVHGQMHPVWVVAVVHLGSGQLFAEVSIWGHGGWTVLQSLHRQKWSPQQRLV
jgi:hypothetical protein